MKTAVLLSLLLASLACISTAIGVKQPPLKIELLNPPETLVNISQAKPFNLQIGYEIAMGTYIVSEGWTLDRRFHSDEEIIHFFDESNVETKFHDLKFKANKNKAFEAGKIYHILYYVNVTVFNTTGEHVFSVEIPVSFAKGSDAVEIVQKTSSEELSEVSLEKGIMVQLAVRVNVPQLQVQSSGWDLDSKYHSENDVKDFFQGGGNIVVNGVYLTVKPSQNSTLKAQTYHLYYFFTAIIGNSTELVTFRKNVPISFVRGGENDVEKAIKFNLFNDPKEFNNVRLGSNITLQIDYTRSRRDVIIKSEGWSLDSKHHGTHEVNGFLTHCGENINGHDLTFHTDNIHQYVGMRYYLYFFVKFQFQGSNKIHEARYPVMLSITEPEDRVDFIVDKKMARGIQDKVTFTIQKEGSSMMGYEIWFINPTTNQKHIIGAGYATETINDISFRFPVPVEHSQVITLVFKYQYQYQNATKHEIRRAITVFRNADVSLTTLKEALEKLNDARELVSVTESIMNMAFKGGRNLKNLQDSQCDANFCSNHGKCVQFKDMYKTCECNQAYEGSRCRLDLGDEARIAELFKLILTRINSNGTNTATEVVDTISRISSVPDIFNYQLIELELKTINMIAGSIVRDRNLGEQIVPAVQSILDLLNNESYNPWNEKDETGLKAVQQIESRLEANLVEIAKKLGLEGQKAKDMTTFKRRKGKSIKDKLIDWVKNL